MARVWDLDEIQLSVGVDAHNLGLGEAVGVEESEFGFTVLTV